MCCGSKPVVSTEAKSRALLSTKRLSPATTTIGRDVPGLTPWKAAMLTVPATSLLTLTVVWADERLPSILAQHRPRRSTDQPAPGSHVLKLLLGHRRQAAQRTQRAAHDLGGRQIHASRRQAPYEMGRAEH